MAIHAGYRGFAKFTPTGGSPVNFRFQDGAMSAKQALNAPDLIMGDYDKGAFNYQKIEVNGSLSGPVTETFAGSILTWACKRDSCGLLTPANLDLYYYCDTNKLRKQSFTGVYANSISFNCTAGDVAQFSLELIGASAGAFSDESNTSLTSTEKIITWDKTGLTITAPTGDSGTTESATGVVYQTFSLEVNNNCEVVYAIQTLASLFPYAVIPGIRNISGSFTAYDLPTFPGRDDWDKYSNNTGSIALNIGSTSISVKCRFARLDPKLSVGPITSSVAFQGLGHQTGSPWV